MLKFVTHAWLAVITYTLTVAAMTVDQFHPLYAAPLVVSASLTAHIFGSYLASRQYRHLTDTDTLNRGMCPVCTHKRLVEVTSARDPEGQRRVVCTGCSSAFAIVAKDGDFITHRLGTTAEP